MKIYLTASQAELLGWNTGTERRSPKETNELIKACFFLGYAATFIHEIVANPMRRLEADSIVDTALLLGMSDVDEIVVAP